MAAKLNYKFITDFHKSRKGRIGASEIPQMIPNPEKPSESLAGYGSTAITLYEEKIGLRKRDPAGLPARIGNFIEPAILHEFMYNFWGKKKADDFLYRYLLCQVERMKRLDLNCKAFNPASSPFKHHTESITDFGVAHSDCIYVPGKNAEGKIKQGGITIDLSKPFGIEAKSSRYWGAVKGYDLDLIGWQGVPWKHFFQIQYQMGLYGYDITYLPLLYNMSEWKVYEVKANKKYITKTMELASDMKRCIDKKQPPKHLAMNAIDIQKLYPEIKEDFREVSGEELAKTIEIAKAYNSASEQEKAWKQKKEDAQNAIAIHLKDTERLKAMINGELIDVAAWRNTGGAERIKALSEIKVDDERVYRYLVKNNMIVRGEKGRKPSIKLKEFGE